MFLKIESLLVVNLKICKEFENGRILDNKESYHLFQSRKKSSFKILSTLSLGVFL